MTASTTASRPTRRRLAVKLNADSRPLVYTVVLLVSALGVVSLIASFQGLIAVAAWARLPQPLAWTVPVMLDGAILVYTAAALIRRARGETTRLAWTGVVAGTVLSASANAAHVVLADVTASSDVLRVIGAGIAALSPVLAALAVHQLADLAVAGPDEVVAPSRRQRRSQALPATPALTSPTGTDTIATPAPQVLPASVRAGTPTGRSTGGASVTERLEAVRALDLTQPGLSERAAAAALCEVHGDAAWISRTTVARMRRRIAEQDGAGAVHGMVAVG